MTEASFETDVAIVGAGPVGLFAVFECGMLKMRSVVIDALDVAGGQCAALYPEKPIFDIPAWPRIDGAELIAQLTAQAAPFRPTYLLGRRVERFTRADDGWLVLGTSAGDSVRCRAVIIAAGAGAFGPNRPPLAGIEVFEGTSVHYYVRDRRMFAGKRLVIAGGGDSALDWTLNLAELAEKIFVVHRREKFRGAPESVARLHALAATGKVELVVPYQLSGLEGAGGALSAVRVATLKGEERSLPADHLLAFFGLSTDLGPIADWGLALEKSHISVTPATCVTSLPGVFAIGDVATYPGKLKLILQGFSEAAMAAHAIHPLVHPGQALHFEYSTTSGVPSV
jgi:thioredoxin reductase (NADPH)